MYIKIDTKTNPPSITVNEAARRANCSKVYITNKIKDDTIDYGFAFDDGENTGQKVVVTNKKWENFCKQTLRSKKSKSLAAWITKDIARQELGISDGYLTKYIMEGALEFDFITNKIEKDHKYYGLLETLKEGNA